ncbi:hypothetical protein J3R82DRAFT_5662 [Butyriboletus roseoflavus]|nr:hypothetical protein J3R82DRAFT_5662 [Butyriboletus roseoflavus]
MTDKQKSEYKTLQKLARSLPLSHPRSLPPLTVLHRCHRRPRLPRPRLSPPPPHPPRPRRSPRLVYNTSTKLSLALKPPAPSYSASIPLLHDLAQHTPALARSTRLLHDNLHGAVLVKDVTNRVKDIIDAIRALIQTFLNNAARGPRLAGTGASGEEYLVRTAALHDLITNARGISGIPKDNRAAVCLSWKSDRESLEDNLQEIARMINQAESNDPLDDSANDSDDGWDEFGLAHATRMDKHELARAKNIHQILRLTTLLHKRIFLDLLAHPSSAPVSAFDTLLTHSNLLLSTSDDLVAALYPAQDPAHVRKEILQLAEVATSFKTQIPVFLPITDELAIQLHALNVDDASPAATSPSPSKKTADKKWFDTCVDQIVRLCTSTTESLSQSEKPNRAT